MLDWLNEKEMAQKLENAIATVIREEKIKTYDMGGTNTSLEVADEVITKF
jgi:3-isopropylmalate dehydrogenase